MPAIKLSKTIIAKAKNASERFNRSIADHIEHRVRIEKIAAENSDLTYEIIKNILIAQQEARAGMLKHYQFDQR